MNWNDLATNFLDAWTSQDVDRVLAVYTEDVVYRDPNTRGDVVGADAMRRYLTKLFAAWQMTWSLREVHVSSDGRGAVLWRASLRRHDGPTVEVEGMDLVELREGRVARNEVYFDRTALAAA
jgi:ketosteroid isomerase-like protein